MSVQQDKRQKIRVGVIASDPLRCIGLCALLEREKDFELSPLDLAEVETLGAKDVVLLTEHRGQDLFELIDRIRAQRPATRLIVVGSESDDEATLNALGGGANGYVNEAAPASEFAKAIRIASQGLVWAPRRICSMLIDRSASSLCRKFLPDALTNREKEVLEMLVAGRSNKEIGDPLGIEERTVKAHVAKLMRKLHVQNRITLATYAITHSLVAGR